MDLVKDTLAKLGLAKCEKSILSLNFNDINCVKLTISKLLSVGIVGGAVLVKVPQILKIVAASSVAGISFASNILETTSIIINLAYNYRLGNPFSTYGEGAFITVQNLIIMALILSYNRNIFGVLILFAAVAGSFYALQDHVLVPMSLLNSLQLSTIAISVSSKLPQIWGNFSAGSTGQLSIITTFLQFAGTVARVLTTLQEVPDPKLIASYSVAAVLNGIILFQIVVYGNKTKKQSKSKKKKE